MARAPLLLFVVFLAFALSIAGQEVDVGLVAQISTYAYDDALNRGGLSFETKNGNDLLQVCIFLKKKGNICSSNENDNRDHIGMEKFYTCSGMITNTKVMGVAFQRSFPSARSILGMLLGILYSKLRRNLWVENCRK